MPRKRDCAPQRPLDQGLISKLTLNATVDEFELTILARHFEIGLPPIENVNIPLVCRIFDQLNRQPVYWSTAASTLPELVEMNGFVTPAGSGLVGSGVNTPVRLLKLADRLVVVLFFTETFVGGNVCAKAG